MNPVLRAAASRVAARAARRYVAGPELTDALRTEAGLRARGLATALGYWDSAGEPPDQVERRYDEALRALASRPGVQLSIKPPALGGDGGRLSALAARAAAAGVPLHCDSLAPGAAAAGLELGFAPRGSDAAIGVTLPGRWRRSLEDAGRARSLGVPARVVKGQWQDPLDPARDPAQGFREVVSRLAGGPAPVAVASHDGPLVASCLALLRESGTPCELQLLLGLPAAEPLAIARRLDVPVRVYVPYGRAYLPYALSALRQHPGRAVWLARDLLRDRREPA